MKNIKIFYTFGTDEIYPYCGGWVEVEAPNLKKSHALFRKFFPDRIPGVLRCANYYTEDAFFKTDMPATGNYNAGCYAKFRLRLNSGVDYQICDCRAYKKGGARHE